jgi:hypothetical protein
MMPQAPLTAGARPARGGRTEVEFHPLIRMNDLPGDRRRQPGPDFRHLKLTDACRPLSSMSQCS